MRFVSELVFTSQEAIDEEVLHKLLDCITFGGKTMKFSVYKALDVVDPSPVVRSFLMKLLLSRRETQAVQTYLNKLLTQMREDFTSFNASNLMLIVDILKVNYFYIQLLS